MYWYLSALCEGRLAAGDAYLRSDDLVIGGMKEAHQHSNSSIHPWCHFSSHLIL